MPKEKNEFMTPVGRLVSGSPFEPQTKDHTGAPLVIKRGPNAGQPTIRYFMALAIPKTEPAVNDFFALIVDAAKRSFPTMFDAGGNCNRPDFAWKFKDGDSPVPDQKGNKPCDKEGYPGNWIFAFSGAHAPKCHGTDGKQMLTDPSSIKRGYYIRILGSVVGNDEMAKPGVYLNYSGVQLVAYGPEIAVGPDTAAAFAGAPIAALPQGASLVPPTPTTAPPGALPVGTGAVAPLPVGTGAVAPLTVGTGAPPPMPGFMAPQPADVTIEGVPYKREALLAAGWTDEQIASAAAK
jgi:hypothetical protein